MMLSAHMDSIGLVATHIDEKGFVHVGAVGGVSVGEVLYAPVRFSNGAQGLICPPENGELAKLKLSDLVVDIGASDEEEAKKLVQVGDTAVYDTPTRAAAGRVISPYLDNRISCLVLLMAMEQLKTWENDLYFVFSAQEEVGTRGAKTAAWAIDPDYGIAVDVTGTGDEPGSKHQGSSLCGKGAAVKVMDRSVICSPALVERLMALAEQKGIPAHLEHIPLGGMCSRWAALTPAPSKRPGPVCMRGEFPSPAVTPIPPPSWRTWGMCAPARSWWLPSLNAAWKPEKAR